MESIKRWLRGLGNRIPGLMVLQFTNKCNARCPQCGMGVTEFFPRTELSLDMVKATIDRAAGNGMKALLPAKKGLL